jgi:predicted O-methyltransferase YrrM
MITLTWRPITLSYDGPAIDTSLTEQETKELARLANNADVLEIGSAYGYSAVAMALGGANKVTAVDPHTWLNSYEPMLQNLIAYNVLDNVEIIRTDSWTALPRLFAEGQTYDLIWIDGDHEAHTVSHDVAWAIQLVRKGGTIACHDYDETTCPGVRIALDAWRQPPQLVDTLALYGPGDGW